MNEIKVVVFPIINSKEKLADIINSVLWWLPNIGGVHVYVGVTQDLLDTRLNNLVTPIGQSRYLDNDSSHISLVKNIEIPDPDYLILHDESFTHNKYIQALHCSLFMVDRCSQKFKNGEVSNWAKVLYTIEKRNISKYDKISRTNYLRMFKRLKNKNKAFCFGSGPSLDQYSKINICQEDIKIISNLILYNTDFLSYIGKTDILAFLDLYAFLTPSEYAADFLNAVTGYVSENKETFVVTGWTRLPLILAHYPQLKNNIVGISNSLPTINFPTPTNPYVKLDKYPNVLRTLMLPMASALADNIYILGADGVKALDNKKTMWNHSKGIKTPTSKSTKHLVYPNINKNKKDVYEEHCKRMEELFLYGENQNKKYISLAPSYIPAIMKRYMGS